MRLCGLVTLTVTLLVGTSLLAAERSGKPFNTKQRELWTTNHIVGTPEPPDPFATEEAFPKLKLHEPLSVGLIPGSNRFGVATRPGKIVSFEIRRDVTEATPLLDVGRTVYGVVFHPDFAKNRYLYVMSVLPGPEGNPKGSRVARYQMKPNAWEADPASEQIVLEWPSGGHNGGCLRFGPDGYLYIATGDGSGIADGNLTGQDITDLTGSILRIDVDHPANGRHYGIPKTTRSSPLPTPVVRFSRSVIGRSGSLASTDNSACGPGKWDRICGKWFISSVVAATTAGV